MTTAILWFKRDLRLGDHPALAHAMELGRVVPLYIYEPDYWRLPDTSGRQFAVTSEAVDDLQEQLRRIGSDLVIRQGCAVEELARLAADVCATHLVSHEETGNNWTYQRDLRVGAWARDAGIIWHELPQSAVVRRLNDRDDWSKLRNAHLRQSALPAPKALPPVELASDPTPAMPTDTCPHRQLGGRRRALEVLESFLSERGQPYRKAMSSPVSAESACSRLSVHLATGAISIREVVQRTAQEQHARKGTRDGWLGSLRSFQGRLAWRDHFMQKLEDEPELEHRSLHPAYETLRPRPADPNALGAWERGETGIPFVDACMRYLNANGWINFRMRAMLMSFASYHLWIDWRDSGLHFARAFTDYEPGIHWPQVQMQSGTTGINTLRIYNPVKQGQDQDPSGKFTRQWCPELADVPDRFLQEPWRWDGEGRVLGKTYPRPIVDLAHASRQARDRIWAVRRDPAFAPQAARVVQKHASRKDRDGHFVNDRAAKRSAQKPQDTRQQSFDF